MKKQLILAFNFLVISQLAFSQSTTVLPDRLSIPNVPGLGTCDNPSKGSTVFNTTDNKMYYCNGTNWQEMTGGGFTLPYTATQNIASPNSLLSLTNSGTGNAISFDGKLKANGSTGTNGSSLAVNANGNPSWQEPVAFCVKGNNGGNMSVTPNTYYKILFPTEEYDLGNNYNIATSIFTAPVNGIYHFEGFYTWTNGTTTISSYNISIAVNNNIVQDISYNSAMSVHNPATIGVDLLLNIGDAVSLRAYIFDLAEANRLISNSSSRLRFTGRLVIRQ